jgi:hypothetical protein
MKSSFNKSLRTFAAFISLVFLAGKAFPQMDSLNLQSKPDIHTMITGGAFSDFSGIGAVANLTLIYDKHIFGLGYSVEGIGFGKIVTDVTYNDLGIGSTTSYTADIKKIYSVEYGRRLSNIISVTGGIAWVTDDSRSAINGYQAPERQAGGYFFHWTVRGNYHADLVDKKMDYLAVPITIKAYLKTSDAAGFELHLQLLPNLQQPMGNIGISYGFGNFPGKK